jgi:hypothetical protein
VGYYSSSQYETGVLQCIFSFSFLLVVVVVFKYEFK